MDSSSIVLFLGLPGSGKDTQANILAEDSGYHVVSTGQLLREEVEHASDQAAEISEYMDQGLWVPDRLVYKSLSNYIFKYEYRKLILTGAVRTVEQVPMLDEALGHVDLTLDKVMYFTLSKEEAVRRLSQRWYCPEDGRTYDMVHNPPEVEGKCDACGADLVQRPDDQPDSVAHRFQETERTINPILAVYKSRGILVEVDASPAIDEIAKFLKQHLT